MIAWAIPMAVDGEAVPLWGKPLFVITVQKNKSDDGDREGCVKKQGKRRRSGEKNENPDGPAPKKASGIYSKHHNRREFR